MIFFRVVNRIFKGITQFYTMKTFIFGKNYWYTSHIDNQTVLRGIPLKTLIKLEVWFNFIPMEWTILSVARLDNGPTH